MQVKLPRARGFAQHRQHLLYELYLAVRASLAGPDRVDAHKISVFAEVALDAAQQLFL